jgi:hypothetical protein
MSSRETEYIPASTASTQALWLARLLGDLLGRDTGAMELKVDSQSALALAKNPMFHERSKHIQVRYHFIRDCLADESIKACTSTLKISLRTCSPSPLRGSSFLKFAAGLGWPTSSQDDA